MTDHANLVYINKSVKMIVQKWKTTLRSYDIVIEHISGVKNVVADYLSRLVVKKFHDRREKKDELIVLTLHHEMKIPDEAYVKIKSVHNDIVGHGE